MAVSYHVPKHILRLVSLVFHIATSIFDVWGSKSEGWRARIEEKGKDRVVGWVLVPPLTKKGDHMHLTKANTRGDELVLKGEEGDAG